MIGWIIFWIIIAIIGLEMFSIMLMPKRVSLICDADMSLVEPGETVTLDYEVRNAGAWAIAYGAISICFDELIEVRESESWCNRHVRKEWSGLTINHHFFLLPHKRFKGRVHVAFDKRGIHTIDRLYFESGDILGFKAVVTPFEPKVSIICTCRLHEEIEGQQVLGGILGDISVRRFIFEDPNLINGYMDYTGREPLKQISWQRTAIEGHLMVKQNDYTTDSDVAVLVNMESRDKQLLEECLILTRTICEDLEHNNIPYTLLSNGDLQDVHEGLGKGHLHKILRRIGTSRLAFYNSFEELVERCMRSRNTNRSYVVITPDKDDRSLGLIDHMSAHSDYKIIAYYASDYVENKGRKAV